MKKKCEIYNVGCVDKTINEKSVIYFMINIKTSINKREYINIRSFKIRYEFMII